jgi:hypothetical protein
MSCRGSYERGCLEPNLVNPTPELPDDTPISEVELPARVRNVLAGRAVAPALYYYGDGKAADQTCDFAEIPTVPQFDKRGEPLNAFVVAPQSRPIVFALSFNLQTCPLMRH